MQMSEEVESRSSPSIVQLTLCQNTQQSGLARVHITQDSHSQVQELEGGKNTDEEQKTCLEGEHINKTLTNLLVIWHFPYEDLSNLTRHIKIIIHLLLSENSDVGSNSVRNDRKNSLNNLKTASTTDLTGSGLTS